MYFATYLLAILQISVGFNLNLIPTALSTNRSPLSLFSIFRRGIPLRTTPNERSIPFSGNETSLESFQANSTSSMEDTDGSNEVDDNNQGSCVKRCEATFSDIPSVFIFQETFKRSVYSSEILTELFNVNTTASEFSQFLYVYVLEVFTKKGSPSAKGISLMATRPIAKYFDYITSDLLVRVYTNAFAKYLFVEDALTPENAENLALSYAREMEASAQRTMTCDPISKYKAIENGIANFLISLRLLAAFEGYDIAFYYANEFILAAIESACNGS
ncbi:uncharacterized protein CDAR_621501 [Caerostris darwini]|uniref:RGS domain-containing protein n=1 Tax=Caerostris darwini TaxID=1538125 RepID=A0AAV4VBJ5_9ARAC|nr:uncharacterized protein CDAR_621501 [Caerostris darwini]